MLIAPKLLVWVRISLNAFPHQSHKRRCNILTAGCIMYEAQWLDWTVIGAETHVYQVAIISNSHNVDLVRPCRVVSCCLGENGWEYLPPTKFLAVKNTCTCWV